MHTICTIEFWELVKVICAILAVVVLIIIKRCERNENGEAIKGLQEDVETLRGELNSLKAQVRGIEPAMTAQRLALEGDIKNIRESLNKLKTISNNHTHTITDIQQRIKECVDCINEQTDAIEHNAKLIHSMHPTLEME